MGHGEECMMSEIPVSIMYVTFILLTVSVMIIMELCEVLISIVAYTQIYIVSSIRSMYL
jgi:hypothetical protein